MPDFGTLKRISLRELWSNEATEFTPWLAEHIDNLGEVLGLDLEFNDREAPVGAFALDLLATDLGTNRTVVIENQITETDHIHLGKLITYASGYEASIVIWIFETIREEHRQALEWLNERTNKDTEFYGIMVEGLQIDDSKPAYNFRPIVFPNDWRKSAKKTTSSELSEREEMYKNYFQQLLDELRNAHNFTNAKAGQPQSWYSFSTGVVGFTYGMSFAQGKKIRVELYIDIGDAEKNKAVFDIIIKNKDTIEREFGETLSWERLDTKRSSRIAIYRDGSIDMDTESLNEIRKWSISKLLQMKKIFKDKLKVYLSEAENKINYLEA